MPKGGGKKKKCNASIKSFLYFKILFIIFTTEIKINENTSQIITSSCEQCNIQCDVCKSVQNKMIVASRVEVVKQIVLEQIQTDTDGNVNFTIKKVIK